LEQNEVLWIIGYYDILQERYISFKKAIGYAFE